MTTPVVEVGAELTSISNLVTMDDMRLFEPQDEKNIHTDDETARAAGLPAAIAAGVQFMAYIFEMLRQTYGSGSVVGTQLDVRIRTPVFAGDTVTARGRVTGSETDASGTFVSLEVWCENQRRDHVIAGTARVPVRGGD